MHVRENHDRKLRIFLSKNFIQSKFQAVIPFEAVLMMNQNTVF